MAVFQIINRTGPRGERHELSAFAVRAFMAFLGTAGTVGCLFSGLGYSFGFGILDVVIVLGSVLFTDAMLRTGYHPYCAAAEAAVCAVFGIVRGRDVAEGISSLTARYLAIAAGGNEAFSEIETEAANPWASAFFGIVLVFIITVFLGQKIRRFLPLFLMTGIIPVMLIAAGIIPGYMYLAMLCLFWAMLLFDADELWGPSLVVMPVIFALFLGFLAAGIPHSPHEPFDFSRPQGAAAAPTTVTGENHDPVSETESTGETLENHDDPEDAHPDGESEFRPDGRDEDGMEIPRQLSRILIVILSLACALLMLPVSRLIRLRLRRKKTHSRDRNASVIAEYAYMEQLFGFSGKPEDISGVIWARATEIGLKAKFSGGTVSAAEVREMHELASRYRDICTRRAGKAKEFYGKYYLAL